MNRSLFDFLPMAVPKPKTRSKSVFEKYCDKKFFNENLDQNLEEKMGPKEMIMVPLGWRPSVIQ